MTAPRLTLQDQLLINLCGWLACARMSDPNHALMIDQVRRSLPLVTQDHPLISPLAEAAQAVVSHIDAPGSMQLMVARLHLDQACQAVFMARAAQAAAAIWPEENTDFTQPSPASEPAHAAE
jgi:hypothetical protein